MSARPVAAGATFGLVGDILLFELWTILGERGGQIAALFFALLCAVVAAIAWVMDA